MTSVHTQQLSAVLDSYSDVIEGGNTYRGSGTAFRGIPGTHSHHDLDGTVVPAGAGSNATGIVIAGIADADALALEAVLEREDSPPWFLVSLAGTNAGAARKVSSYTLATNTIVVADFPQTPAEADTFEIVEGFKRTPDRFPLAGVHADATKGAFDRYFHLEMLPGRQLDFSGDGRAQYEGTLRVRMRFIKKGRDKTIIDSALDNIGRLRPILVLPQHRDGVYTDRLSAEANEPEPEEDGPHHITVKDDYRITYRMRADFL